MQATAQAWLVLQLTHSAWFLGLVGALQFVPMLLFSLPGGVLVDRFPKRRVLLWTQGSGLLQAVILWLLVVTSLIEPWHLMVLAICWGLTNSLDVPARQSIVIELVGRADLPNAVTLNSSQFSVARAVGPALAGLLIDWSGGVAPVFLLNALSFVPVLVGLALMETGAFQAEVVWRHEATRNAGLWKSLQEGLVYTARTPAVLLIMIIIGLVSLFGINFNVVLPLFATNVLHTGATGFGLLTGAFGLGAFLSGMVQAWGNKRASLSSLLGSALLFCLVEGGFALSRWYILSLVLITAVGFLQILFSATANTTLQTVVPHRLRGRVMGLYALVFAGTTPLGNLGTGALATVSGASFALLTGALCGGVAAAAGWFWRAPAEKSIVASSPTDVPASS